MVETHCTNAGCSEVDLAKQVLEALSPGAVIICGACGQPMTEPAETTAEPGSKVR